MKIRILNLFFQHKVFILKVFFFCQIKRMGVLICSWCARIGRKLNSCSKLKQDISYFILFWSLFRYCYVELYWETKIRLKTFRFIIFRFIIFRFIIFRHSYFYVIHCSYPTTLGEWDAWRLHKKIFFFYL